MQELSNRVTFAIQCSALPAFTVLCGLLAVAFGRMTSGAVDPVTARPSRALAIHTRFLTGSVEQVVLFFIAALSLATFLDADAMRLIPVAAILFVVSRIVFWLGYLRDPQLRALGLPGSFYVVSFMSAWAAYRAVMLLF